MSNRIVKTFQKAYQRKEERNWDRIYVLVDLHETVMIPNYDGLSTQFYKDSLDCLRELSNRDEIVLIMWTCSIEEHREEYNKMFKKEGVNFDYINENPEVFGKLEWGDYESKMYTNVLLDDKAGFDFETDWEALKYYLTKKLLIDSLAPIL